MMKKIVYIIGVVFVYPLVAFWIQRYTAIWMKRTCIMMRLVAWRVWQEFMTAWEQMVFMD